MEDISQKLISFAQALSVHRGEAPLNGDWHHGNGVLVCGTVRIAREDFDTLPSDKVRNEIFDWMCATLNAAPVTPAGDERNLYEDGNSHMQNSGDYPYGTYGGN